MYNRNKLSNCSLMYVRLLLGAGVAEIRQPGCAFPPLSAVSMTHVYFSTFSLVEMTLKYLLTFTAILLMKMCVVETQGFLEKSTYTAEVALQYTRVTIKHSYCGQGHRACGC